MPPEIAGWNWGAFFLTWIWGIGNRVWLSFLVLIPVPFVALLAMMVILGIKGNEWAWQCKRWDSIEQFRRRQRIWMYWGIAGFLAPFFFILGWVLIIAGLLGYYGYI
ncbi:MAG: ribonuclease G [Chloroflexota bacterium]|nr:MAG: ribonuclease G [Chloroflexota bacterium]